MTKKKQTEEKEKAGFLAIVKEKLVALFQRLKKWPVGWLINLGLAILVMILSLAMLVDWFGDSRGGGRKQEQESSALSKVDTYLEQMTLEEKLGQLFMARVPVDNQIEDVKNYHLGGYLLFGRDVEGETLDTLKKKIADYQVASQIPLLIGSDEEGGYVSRLSPLLETPFGYPIEIFQQGGMKQVLSDVEKKADQLKELGIHAGLFPVADIATDYNAFIYYRTLGQDLETTKSYVAEATKVLQDKKVLSTLKHFPGYGNNGDSHYSLIYDYRTLEDLQAMDLQVFEAGIKAGADSVLVSHNILPDIDDQPASISPEINRILREDLGFDGVVMTDDFDMEGLAQFTSQEEAAYLAIQAGNDMILTSQYANQIPYLLEKVANGELTEDRIDQSVRRILKMKDKLGLLPAVEEDEE